MKIGILTFHRAHNYGAVLQAYALLKKINSMGHEAEIINYSPDYIDEVYQLIPVNSNNNLSTWIKIRNALSLTLSLPIKIKRRYKFLRFIKSKLNVSKNSCTTTETISPDFDRYVFGSDQIWNDKITKTFDKVFFGDFKTKKEAKKISYAVSMGQVELPINSKNYLTEALRNFDHLSVRESHLVTLLQPLTEKKICHALDPALLLDPSLWNKLSISPKLKQKYVLVYQVKACKDILQIAAEIARQLNAQTVEIATEVNWHITKYKYQCSSPEEFIGLIRCAECIITTSFHGTVFSVIYNRPFYAVELNDGDSRVKNFLEILELAHRSLSVNSKVVYSGLDYSRTNVILDQLRKDSNQYLEESLR